jgi:hypothetical protein
MKSNGWANIDGPRVMLTTTIHLSSTARMAMALAGNGCRVFAMTPPAHPLRLTRVASLILPYGPFRPLNALEAAFRDTSPDFVIPCDERAVRHLHQLHRSSINSATRALIERSLGDPENYTLSEARHDLLVAAREVGVVVPATRPLAGVENLFAWSMEFPLPWVLKADGSYAGQGVRVVSSLLEAEAAFNKLNRVVSGALAVNKLVIDRDPFWLQQWREGSRPAISVQSYVEGRPANCSVACWEGEVLAGITMEVLVAESRTGPSIVSRVVDNAEMLEAARRVARRLGLSGLVGFDFIVETATGIPQMIEMNPRNTPICHLNLGPERDLVEALTAKLSGRAKGHRPSVTSMDVIAFFPDAWQADPESEYLRSGYHDVPWGEPLLLRELLTPDRRDRHWLTRQIRRMRGHKKESPLAFPVSLGTLPSYLQPSNSR